MVQSNVAKANALHDLGYKIFLDRYAQKDMTRHTLKTGDTVIVVVDAKTGQREIGTVTAMALPKVTIKLRDGDIVERDLEHVDKPLETEPEQMMDRVAAGIAQIEATDALRSTWTDNFRWLLDDWRFVPGGRILAGAGTDQELTYYNCMPPQQEILTADGYRPIAEVMVGDYVVTHKNRLRRVLHKFERETEEDLFILGVKKIGYDQLRLTGEHKVLAIRSEWINTHRSRDGVRLQQEPQWIPSKDLKVGDYLALAYNGTSVERSTIRISDYIGIESLETEMLYAEGAIITSYSAYQVVDNYLTKASPYRDGSYVAGRKPGINNELIMDADLTYVLGRWVGDGCVTHRSGTDIPSGIKIVFNLKELGDAQRIAAILTDKFGVTAEIKLSSTERWYDLWLNSMPVGEFFKSFIGAYSYAKRLPNEIMHLTDDLALAFLRGLFGADGYTSDNKVGIVLSNRVLCVQVHQMLLRLGYVFSIQENTHRLGTVPAYRVHAAMSECEALFGVFFDRVAPVKATKLKTHLRYNDQNWLRITTIATENYSGHVLDIEVDEDHSFVSAGVVVSNCYVIPSPNDSRGGIMDTLGHMTEIMSRGGGVGINISSLRPRHAYVRGVNGRSSGSVSWGALYSFVTGLIEQGGCFGPDERIQTTVGLLPAVELADRIDKGETFYAQTHEGARRITARFRNGVKPLYEVTTSRGYKVRITEDHKVAVLMDGNITTMPLKYLTTNDEILLLLGDGVQADPVTLQPVVYERSVMSTTLNENIHLPETLNEELAYLVGYLHGDGYVHIGRKVTWAAPKAIKMATADAHPQIRERLIDIIRRQFGKEAIVEVGDGACRNVVVYSRLLLEWLKQNGLLKAEADAVRVPEAIFRSSSSVMGAFIAGYFDADGCDRGRKAGYGMDSISRTMLADVQELLSVNGIISSISATDRSAQGWQTIYRLTITGAEFKKRFAALVPAQKVGEPQGTRDMYHTYPAQVWRNLEVRTKYRQRIYDGVSQRISFAQMTNIGERPANDSLLEAYDAVQTTLRTLPDRIASIELLGDSEVYDFEVDDVHLLSGSGIYTSNSRRGALMLILNDWHPDVFDFINSKRQAGNITNANISVGISDRFMDAVKADADWDLMFPDTSTPNYDTLWDGDMEKWIADGHKVIVYKTIKAKAVWDAMIESAWASAEPGVWFRERSNKMSNSWYFSQLISTNPCGEQPLSAWSVCNLGALNLAKFYDADRHDVAWDALERAVRYSVRFLDNVIDSTPYFFPENETKQTSERRVGLGTMGVAELMIYCGVRYGSDESVTFIEKLYRHIAVAAYHTSAELAAEKGAFSAFDADKVLQSGFMQQMPDDVRQTVRQKGLRNVTLLTQAPTGTTGTMVNTSTGIEPFFSWVYYRKSRLGLHEEQVPVVAEWHAAHPDVEKLPDHFITAMELSPEEHVKVQGAFQRWIDSAISKTCNVPNHYTVEQVSDLYLEMYALGCKGGTIYRDGSRSEQVLMLKGDKRAEDEMDNLKKEDKSEPKAAAAPPEIVHTPHKEYPRPTRLTGTTVKFKTPFGTAYITMNNDEKDNPFEVFITVGKAGSDIQADAEAMGRMISLQLRTTAPHNRREMLRLLKEQLSGIGGARPMGFGSNRVLSLPDAVANAIDQYYFNAEVPQQLGLPMAGVDNMRPASLTEKPANGNGGTSIALSSMEVIGFSSGADMCPECGTISLIRMEGCRKCTTCGYSEC